MKNHTHSPKRNRSMYIKMNQRDDIVFLNKDYIQLTRSKIYICKYIFDLNLSIFDIDQDIALFKNPFHCILSAKIYQNIICFCLRN